MSHLQLTVTLFLDGDVAVVRAMNEITFNSIVLGGSRNLLVTWANKSSLSAQLDTTSLKCENFCNVCKQTSCMMENLTCYCTRTAMSPAGAAVLRDVLVTSCAGVVHAIYVPPVPGLWQLSEVQEFMKMSCGSERDSSSH